MKTAAFIIVAVLVLLVWAGIDWQRGRGARARYVEETSPFAARLLEKTGEVPDELIESSGIAVSRTRPGVLWSHNDSGNGPMLYAMDISGRLLGSIRVTGAESFDWEDIAEGPCPRSSGEDTRDEASRCLYIADIGDNDGVRDQVSVYIVTEPERVGDDGWPQTVEARALRYRYPDGADDSEALAVAPDGDIVIVSKGRSGAIDVFTLLAAQVREALRSGLALMATPILRTSIEPNEVIGRLVTGAAIAPNGKTLAVRTYNEVYFFEAVAGQPGAWQDAHRGCALGAAEPLGEAIDFLDDDTLVLTSERFGGLPGYIHRVEC